MTTFTVTGAVTNPYLGFALKVLVVTGAAEAGGASGTANNYQAAKVSITPNFSGSLLIFGINLPGVVAAMTPAASNTFIDSGVNVVGDGDTDGYYSGTVTSGTPVTVGSSSPTGDYTAIAAYELPAAGTPAIDYSTPVVATCEYSGEGTVTTVPFTPPGGALLAAIMMFNIYAPGSVLTVTDTSGLGLTWTPRVSYIGTGYNGGAAIYTTTVPARAGQNTSPAYAANYAILGGGTGSWVNPGNAEGAPDGSYATWTAP